MAFAAVLDSPLLCLAEGGTSIPRVLQIVTITAPQIAEPIKTAFQDQIEISMGDTKYTSIVPMELPHITFTIVRP